MGKGVQKLKQVLADLSTVSILILTGLAAAVLAFASDSFLTYSNIYSILYGISIEGFAVIGFTYLMVMGEIDLSVGAVYALSGTLTGYLMLQGAPIGVAAPAALLVCAAIGAVNGGLTVRFKLNSLMVTIGMMILVRGVVDVLIPALAGSTFSRSYRALVRMRLGRINVSIIVLIVLVAVLEFLLRRGAFFKKLYYIGENAKSAQVYGIGAGRIKIAVFTLTSTIAGMGGILAGSRIMHADVTTGKGLEFKVVTAAVLGGASLFGGRGSILGSAMGLVFLAVVLNGMVKFNIEPLLQQLVVGVILIAAVFFDTLMNRRES